MGRIEMLDSALAAFPKSTRSDLWRLAIVGLVTGLVVTVLLVKEAYFVPVILDIHSRTLSADVDSAGSLSAISLGDSVHVRGADWMVAPPAMEPDAAAAHEATVRADWLRLDNFEYPAGSSLDFRRGPKSLSLFLTGAPVVVQFQVSGKTDVEYGLPPTSQTFSEPLATPEAFRFGTDKPGDGAKRDRMLEIIGDFGDANSANIALAPSSVRFLERATASPGGAPRDESSIVGGTVSFKGVNRSFKLADGDVLIVEGLTEARGKATIQSDIHLLLSGKASVIAISDDGSRHSLAPSLLEYLAENHAIWLAWSSLVFVAGLLWPASGFLFR